MQEKIQETKNQVHKVTSITERGVEWEVGICYAYGYGIIFQTAVVEQVDSSVE